MFRLLVAIGLMVTLVGSPLGYGQTEDDSPSDQSPEQSHRSGPTPDGRPVDGDDSKFIDRATDLFQDLSGLESRDYLKEIYGSVTPGALNAATSEAPDEAKIAATLAAFTGIINVPQLKELDTKIWDQIKTEWDKQPRDKRYLALLRRLLTAKNLILGKRAGSPLTDPTSGKEFDADLEPFKVAFRAEYRKVQASNKVYDQQMKLAKQGNEAAIKYVRERNPRILMDYLNKEIRTNTETAQGSALTKGQYYANDVMQALSHPVAEGRRVFDFALGNGEQARVELGAPDQHYVAFQRAVAEGQLAFDKAKVEPRPFEKPARVFRAAAAEAVTAGAEATTLPKSTEEKAPPPEAPKFTPRETATRALIETKCLRCHGPNSKDTKARDHLSLDPGELANLIKDPSFKETVQSATDLGGPMEKKVTDSERQLISTWAKEK